MKLNNLLVALLLAVPLSLCAREWRDMKGRTFHGVLVAVDGAELTFEKYGVGMMTAPLAISSPADRDYVTAWKAARGSAIIISGEVFQATKTGALLKGTELRRETKVEDVPKYFSQLDQKMITEKKPVTGWKSYPLASEHVFIEGLDDVLDKTNIAFLVVWPAGFHDYTTAGGAFRRVVKYTLTPPAAK